MHNIDTNSRRFDLLSVGVFTFALSVSRSTLICKTAPQASTSSQPVTLKIDKVSLQASKTFTYNKDPAVSYIQPRSSFFRWVSRSVGFAPAFQLCTRYTYLLCLAMRFKTKKKKESEIIYCKFVDTCTIVLYLLCNEITNSEIL